MKPEDQVVNLELSKRLKELGVKQESVFHWVEGEMGGMSVSQIGVFGWTEKSARCSAFTVAELGEMLPVGIKPQGTVSSLRIETFGEPKKWRIQYMRFDDVGAWVNDREPLNPCTDEKEADARAKMLIHLIETGAVKP